MGRNKFASGAYAIWNSENSTQTEYTSDTECVFYFPYTVDVLPEQYINHVSVSLPVYTVGDQPTGNATSLTDGITVKEVKFVESFEKIEAGKEYTVNIILSNADEYLFADAVTATEKALRNQGFFHFHGGQFSI